MLLIWENEEGALKIRAKVPNGRGEQPKESIHKACV